MVMQMYCASRPLGGERLYNWAEASVALLTPATKWVKGDEAEAYHRYLEELNNQAHLKRRRESVEPAFDLVAQVAGTSGKQKELPVQGIENVRTNLTLSVVMLQLGMIVNSIYGLPHRAISHMRAALS